MRLALTRAVSPRINECALSHLPREAIDVAAARDQHRAYCEQLVGMGCTLVELPAEPDLADGVFVEDTVVVLDELAVLARPGVVGRRAETATMATALGVHRRLHAIEPPGTLDGGDVLRVGRVLLVGVSGRTNDEGARQLAALVRDHGSRVELVAVTGCLHLKSACTAVGPDLVVINRDWVDADAVAGALPGAQLIDVHADEPRGANHLWCGGCVLSPASCPRTVDRLRALGLTVNVIDNSELEKAEAGVTCCSVLLEITA